MHYTYRASKVALGGEAWKLNSMLILNSLHLNSIILNSSLLSILWLNNLQLTDLMFYTLLAILQSLNSLFRSQS